MRDQKSPNLPLDLTVEMKLLNINADTHSKSSVYKITKLKKYIYKQHLVKLSNKVPPN